MEGSQNTSTLSMGEKPKKLGLKRVKKKNELNTSKAKFKPTPSAKKDFSYLNMSVQKQTLRANNRALAQNLAKTKQELREANQYLHEMQSQNQDLKTELNRLKRIAGITDDKIEAEVQTRIKDTMQEMKSVCEQLTQSMVYSSQYITQIFDKCNVYCRRSTASARNSSIDGELRDIETSTTRSTNNPRRNVFGSASETSTSSSYLSNIGDRPSSGSVLSRESADMSIIAEQSILADDGPVFVSHDLEPVAEIMTGTDSAPLSKLPQRIPTGASSQDSQKTVKPIVGPKEKLSKNKTSENSAKSSALDKGCKSDSQRSELKTSKQKLDGKSTSGTKEMPEKTKESNKNKLVSHRSGNCKTLSADIADVTLEGDISAFGFGGSFASELVSGSPISRVKHTKSKGNGKSVDFLETADEGEKQKKLRRETFVMPKPPTDNVNKEKSTCVSDKVGISKKSNEESSIKVSTKSKQNTRKNTHVTENPFAEKPKVARSPGKKHLQERTSKQPESVPIMPPDNQTSPYDSVKDPFRPTKTLFRSPPYEKIAKPNTTHQNAAEPMLDSRAFIASLKKSKESTSISPAISPLPEPMFVDEPTTYISADMELTAVIDTTSFQQSMSKSNKPSPNLPIVTVEEPSPNTDKRKEVSNRNNHTDKKPSARSKPASKSTKDRTDTERVKSARSKPSSKSIEVVTDSDSDAAVVEMRNKKPGQFTFNVNRKEADGSRKPVPEQMSKARSKKRAVTPEKVPDRKTGDDRDMFNFGDRTPTMPLEKLALSAPNNAYDLSMNESVHVQVGGLKGLREKEIHKRTEKKIPECKPDEYIYYEPLKGGSPDEKPVAKRSRSKSGTRSKSQTQYDSDDNDEWVPGGKTKSKSRARSRGRSVGRQDDEVDSIEQAAPRRGRSQSRPRKHVDTDEECDEISVSRADNKTADSKTQASRSKARNGKEECVNDEMSVAKRESRKSRVRDQTENEDDNETDENVATKRGRSRSRARKVADDKIESEIDIEKNVNIICARSKSRARKVADDNESAKDFEKDEKLPLVQTDSRSRARKSIHESVNDDNDNLTVTKRRSRKSRVEDTTENESETERNVAIRRARSRSRARKVDVENKSEIDTEKNVETKHRRSRSRARKVADDENRSEIDFEKVEKLRLEHSGSRSRARKSKHESVNDDNDNLTVTKRESLKSRVKDENVENESEINTERNVAIRHARSKSRARKVANEENESEIDFEKDKNVPIEQPKSRPQVIKEDSKNEKVAISKSKSRKSRRESCEATKSMKSDSVDEPEQANADNSVFIDVESISESEQNKSSLRQKQNNLNKKNEDQQEDSDKEFCTPVIPVKSTKKSTRKRAEPREKIEPKSAKNSRSALQLVLGVEN